jgi:ribosomal RNA-processing protein 9
MATSTKKRRPAARQGASNHKRTKPVVDLAAPVQDDHIESDDSRSVDHEIDDESSLEDLETKRVRLARDYLDRIDQAGSSSESEQEEDEPEDDRISRKLQKDRLQRQGVWEENIADKVYSNLQKVYSSYESSTNATVNDIQSEQAHWISAGHVRQWKGHDLTVTSVALQADGTRAISGSKDHSVIMWDVENEKPLHTICKHWRKDKDGQETRNTGQVLTVACSDDGRYAAVGCRDATIRIFDIRTAQGKLEHTFTGHRGPVTSLCFRTRSHQLFSASQDRCVRHYSVPEQMCVETLFGHQSEVLQIACHAQEQPVSVGRDRTARLWKLSKDTHLIFRGGAQLACANTVSVAQDGWFVTGHEDNHVCLWMTEKKKAVASIANAHDSPVGVGVVSLACLRGSDMAITGSCDDYLRVWKLRTGRKLDERGMDNLGRIPLKGYVNDIAIGPKGRFCLVAQGQEHRLGRWNPVKKARNRVVMIRLREEQEKDDGDDERSSDGSGEDSDEGNEQQLDKEADATDSDGDSAESNSS